MSRKSRKDEHLYFGALRPPGEADFSDISFVHNCLPEIDYSAVSLKCEILGWAFRSPLYFNAITGGTRRAFLLNAALARAAGRLGLPMAVGSQRAAFADRQAARSFTVVRKYNPNGSIWANIGATATLKEAAEAVRLIKADALQLHLNAPQEAFMAEGERSFAGTLKRIEAIAGALSVPVIVKEVGFGIDRDAAAKLTAAGVSAIDIAGSGGTDFIAIECRRSGLMPPAGLCCWGIPTAISLIETLPAVQGRAEVFASGGLNSALNIAKALSLGAKAVGLAALPLYYLTQRGEEAMVERIGSLQKELRRIMFILGAADIGALQRLPLVIRGKTADWISARGGDPAFYARRGGSLQTGDYRDA